MDLTHTDARGHAKRGRACRREAREGVHRTGGGAEGRLATLLSYEGELAINEDHIDEAIELQKRALAMQEHHVSPDDTELAAYLDRLSFAELTKGDTDAALAYSQRSLAIRREGPRSRAPDGRLFSEQSGQRADAGESARRGRGSLPASAWHPRRCLRRGNGRRRRYAREPRVRPQLGREAGRSNGGRGAVARPAPASSRPEPPRRRDLLRKPRRSSAPASRVGRRHRERDPPR